MFLKTLPGAFLQHRIFLTASLSDLSATDLSAADLPVEEAAAGVSFHFGTPQIIILALILFALIMLALELLRSRFVLNVTRSTIVLPELPSNFSGAKAVVISDLHQMRFGDYNEELAKRIRREEPDYVFFVGDMGDAGKFDVDAFYDLLEALGDGLPVLMVPGDDDLRLGNGSVHKNFLHEVERAGAIMLNNTCAEMNSGGQKLYIYGFCQPLAAEKDTPASSWKLSEVTGSKLHSLLGRCPDDAPVIMLAHDPRPFEEYAKWGASLVISGHMHGGLIRLPWLGGLFSPDKSGKPTYTAGLYTKDNAKLFVTRGLGASKGLRLFNSPELAVITLSVPGGALSTQHGDDLEAKEQLSDMKSWMGDQFTSAGSWFKSESRSLAGLINERSTQVRDFFALLFGKKRSRFAIEADKKKRANTYIAPKGYGKSKNKNKNK